jgi:hypothetical protein
MTDDETRDTGGARIGNHPRSESSLFGPLGFLYVLTYCLLVITMDWKGWWPAIVGCIVMASWPVTWAVGGALIAGMRRRRR